MEKKKIFTQKLNFSIRFIKNCSEPKKCLVVADDGKIYFFDLEKEEYMEDKLFEGHSDIITDIAFLHSQNKLVTCSLDQTIKIWDERNGFIDSIQLEEEVYPWGLAILEQNQEIVVGTEDGCFYVYDLN